MLSSLPFEAQLLFLRGVALVLLYLFIGLVVLVVVGDLRRAARKPRPLERRSELGQLVLVEPGPTGLEPGKIFPLSPISSIGRALRNTVSLDDEFLSSEHSLLSWRDNTWWLEDLASTNGTFMNGVRVNQAVPISPGDLLEIGRVVLRLEL